MKLRLALAAATCLAMPIAAHAQPVSGPYVSLAAGTGISNSVNYNYEAASRGGKFISHYDYAGTGAVGYGFGNGLRIELGGDFLRNTMHKDDTNVSGNFPAYGGKNTYGAMVNALYDLDIGLPVSPYVGAGVGYQFTKFSSRVNDVASSGTTVEGTKGSFAYDVIGGLSYPVPAVAGLALTAEYRFMMTTSSRNYASTTVETGASAGPVHIGQQTDQIFTLGARYALFPAPVMAPAVAPAPAPAPVAAAPAPVPARTFLVFFDWDKASLTPRATQIIAEAASDSKTASATVLSVSGYTDTSGTTVYNQGLSMRRAKAVAGQLVTDGVAASEIEIHAYGDTHLLVPTGPGVREPQNRRVEIVLN